jgi:hypothetical protein
MGWINGSLRGVMNLKIGHSRMRIGKTATAEIQGKPTGVPIVVKSCGERIALHECCSTKT